jgi:hypothetical protein
METATRALPNIAEFKDLTHIPYFIAAILLIDVFTLFLTRYFPEKVGGESLNDWYDNFGLEGVVADVFVILLGFLITQYIYSGWVSPSYGWNPLLFVGLLVVVQLVHDALFYTGVIKQIPSGLNAMMDTYKKYAEENGGLILLGDAGLMLGSAAAVFALESAPPYVAVAVACLTVYTLPYILNTKMQGSYKYVRAEAASASAAAAPPKEQTASQPIRQKEKIQWDVLKPQVQSSVPDKVENTMQWKEPREMESFHSGQNYSPYSLL